jgi:hypothetical protein
LKHHAEATPLRRTNVDALFVQPDAAGTLWQQAGKAIQYRRLPTSGRAEQGNELTALDSE